MYRHQATANGSKSVSGIAVQQAFPPPIVEVYLRPLFFHLKSKFPLES